MFRNRADAAEHLAKAVADAHPPDPVVLALPRGGVPLGAVVAERLGAPLDLVLVRKIGLPGHEELAAGAIVEGVPVFNPEVLRASGLTEAEFAGKIADLNRENEERRQRYLPGRAPEPVEQRTAILVDDGIATGATIRAAIAALRRRKAGAIWVAVPVGPPDTVRKLTEEADRVICLETPTPFWAVGAHYRDFGQVSDAEVVRWMESAGKPQE